MKNIIIRTQKNFGEHLKKINEEILKLKIKSNSKYFGYIIKETKYDEKNQQWIYVIDFLELNEKSINKFRKIGYIISKSE